MSNVKNSWEQFFLTIYSLEASRPIPTMAWYPPLLICYRVTSENLYSHFFCAYCAGAGMGGACSGRSCKGGSRYVQLSFGTESDAILESDHDQFHP
jgi:hypothetical protein